jgi:hypothetical protein
MNANYRKLLAVLVGLALFAIAAEVASAQSWLDGSSKMRGDYGQMSRSVVTARPMYQATAPNGQRSFSYEPAQAASAPAPAANGCDCGSAPSAATAAPAPMAQTQTQSTRSFSYEPSTRAGVASPMVRGAQTPAYLVPKSLR